MHKTICQETTCWHLDAIQGDPGGPGGSVRSSRSANSCIEQKVRTSTGSFRACFASPQQLKSQISNLGWPDTIVLTTIDEPALSSRGHRINVVEIYRQDWLDAAKHRHSFCIAATPNECPRVSDESFYTNSVEKKTEPVFVWVKSDFQRRFRSLDKIHRRTAVQFERLAKVRESVSSLAPLYPAHVEDGLKEDENVQ